MKIFLIKSFQKIYSVLNYFLYIWPGQLGGIYLRRYFWGKALGFCGEKVIFGDRISINGFASIKIGNFSNFMDGSFIYSDEGQISIGDSCSFNHNVMISSSNGGNISIGNNVLIGPNVFLRASEHVYEDINMPISTQGHIGGSIIIEDGVWIASNVVITKDVHIGTGTIIGAGSVVSNDLPKMTVCAGNPAVPIRSRII